MARHSRQLQLGLLQLFCPSTLLLLLFVLQVFLQEKGLAFGVSSGVAPAGHLPRRIHGSLLKKRLFQLSNRADRSVDQKKDPMAVKEATLAVQVRKRWFLSQHSYLALSNLCFTDFTTH